jgi:hypothetical protein
VSRLPDGIVQAYREHRSPGRDCVCVRTHQRDLRPLPLICCLGSVSSSPKARSASRRKRLSGETNVWSTSKIRDGRLCICLARTSWSIQSPGPPIGFFVARLVPVPNGYTYSVLLFEARLSRLGWARFVTNLWKTSLFELSGREKR